MRVRFSNTKVDFTRYVFQQCHKVKSYAVYELESVTGNYINKLTEKIRIEQFRGKSNATGINLYFRLRDSTNWTKCTQVTGLRKFDEVTFYGDDNRGERKSLLVFHFQNDGKTLIIDYFNSLYPYTPIQRNSLMMELKKALPKFENASLSDLKIQQLDLFQK